MMRAWTLDIDAHWDTNGNSLAESVRINHDRLRRRVFNTHLRWDMLPKRQEGGSIPPHPNDQNDVDATDMEQQKAFGVAMVSVNLLKMCKRPSRACFSAFTKISYESPLILISI